MAARTYTLPAPVGGWNDRDALSDMKESEAVIMDNWFPGTSKVTLRRGSSSHATGIGSSVVESLLVYNGLSASKMFACGNSAIYDASSAGAVGAAAKSGLSNNRWQHVNFGTAGGFYLFACNGADTPQTFDGTSWADSTLTGPTLTSVVWCNVFKNRLYIGENNKLSFWYGGANAIAGAFTEFNLYSVAKKGGYVMGMISWTRDGGSGPDDLAAFVTSQGEVIIYQGTNPGSDFALVGVFEMGKPIGRRFALKAGADVVLVTDDGFIPMAQTLQAGRERGAYAAISDKINKTVNTAVRNYGSLYGWQPIGYPRGPWLLFNVPVRSGAEYHQYVFNSITGAACRFKGMEAVCWGLFGDNLYFGSIDGKVYKADTGAADGLSNIEGDLMQAFSYFKTTREKMYQMAQPVFEATGDIAVALDLNTDFSVVAPTSVPETTGTGPAVWDSSLWDVGLWAGEADIYKAWRATPGMGRAAALRIRLSTNVYNASLLATDFIYEPAGLWG